MDKVSNYELNGASVTTFLGTYGNSVKFISSPSQVVFDERREKELHDAIPRERVTHRVVREGRNSRARQANVYNAKRQGKYRLQGKADRTLQTKLFSYSPR